MILHVDPVVIHGPVVLRGPVVLPGPMVLHGPVVLHDPAVLYERVPTGATGTARIVSRAPREVKTSAWPLGVDLGSTWGRDVRGR